MQADPNKIAFVDYHHVSQDNSNEAIKVVVRFRTNEVKDIDSISIKEDGKSITVKRIESVRKSLTMTRNSLVKVDLTKQQKSKVFHYDAVTDKEDQKSFYENFAKDNVVAFLKGFNSTILAYGSTGSGKTFTIIGDDQIEHKILRSNCKDYFQQNEKQGILPRSIQTICEELEGKKLRGLKYILKCSYLEVYNEELTDLLCSRASHHIPTTKRPLIQECPKKGIVIQNMIEEQVNTYQEIFKCLQRGVENRRVCVTQDNNRSSRSHTIFMLNLEQISLDNTQMLSRLCIVDLAGSEKLQSNQKNRMLETKNINTSLLTLAKCITHLSKDADQKNDKKHVPFRESKLTRILKESLGGNSKTTLICTTRFSEKFQEETIQTLRFAREAKKIQNQVQVKIVYTEDQLLAQIEKLKQDNAMLHKQIQLLQIQLSLQMGSDSVSTPKSATPSSTTSTRGEDHSKFSKSLRDYKRQEASTFPKTKNGNLLSGKVQPQLFDESVLIRLHSELAEYKIRYESLTKSSEEQIMQMNAQIKTLNDQIAKSNDNKILEIEQTIEKLANKYKQQEIDIQNEKQILRDVQKVLADQSSASPKRPKRKLNTSATEEDEEEEGEIGESDEERGQEINQCQFIECHNNRLKLHKFENLFVQFEKQYTQLYKENQTSRKILQEISQKLKGSSSFHDLNVLNDSQIQIFGEQESYFIASQRDFDEIQNDYSYDDEKEEAFLEDLKNKILAFEDQQKIFTTQLQSVQQDAIMLNQDLERQNQNNPNEEPSNRKSSYIQTLDDIQINTQEQNNERSPAPKQLLYENTASSRRKKQKNKQKLNQSLNLAYKTPSSAKLQLNKSYNIQESTPINRLNQSTLTNSSNISDVLEAGLTDLDLSRIENSDYDDYENDSISVNLYGVHKSPEQDGEQDIGLTHKGKNELQKQLFQNENTPEQFLQFNPPIINQNQRQLIKQNSII